MLDSLLLVTAPDRHGGALHPTDAEPMEEEAEAQDNALLVVASLVDCTQSRLIPLFAVRVRVLQSTIVVPLRGCFH